MRHKWSLGEFDPSQSDAVTPVTVDPMANPVDQDRRLMREAKRRMAKLQPVKETDQPLSRVEQAMRRNAPDLVDFTEPARRKPARRRSDEIVENRWPRPRLLALILVITLAAVVPSVTLRLAIWMIVMFLLTAVLMGPERARDGVRSFALHLFGLWDREMDMLRRLIGRDG